MRFYREMDSENHNASCFFLADFAQCNCTVAVWPHGDDLDPWLLAGWGVLDRPCQWIFRGSDRCGGCEPPHKHSTELNQRLASEGSGICIGTFDCYFSLHGGMRCAEIAKTSVVNKALSR